MGSIDYAYARLAARHGQRPGAAHWHRVATARSFAVLLDALRGTPFESWTRGLTPASDAHAAERLLRERWRAHVAEVASWMPERWQAATRWCAIFPDLPALAHLARGGASEPWMGRDDRFAQIDRRTPPAGELAPLRAAWGAPGTLSAAWQAEWHRRMPSGDAGPLPSLEHAIASHVGAFRRTALTDGTPLRDALYGKLAMLFRRAVATPAAAFVSLALTLLELERLRGEILRRLLFARAPLAR